jgi:hypothetical protein
MSTLSGLILPYKVNNDSEGMATVQKDWVQAGLEAACSLRGEWRDWIGLSGQRVFTND